MPYDLTDAKEDITALYNEVAALEKILAEKGIIEIPAKKEETQEEEPEYEEVEEEAEPASDFDEVLETDAEYIEEEVPEPKKKIKMKKTK